MENVPREIGLAARETSVSCLMVTLAVPGRFPFAKRSINDFCQQTWANKNLIVVINGGDESGRRALRDYAESLGRDDIDIYTPPDGLNLGELRNFSVEAARGDVLCQWDDDDFYHPQRLERQLAVLLEGGHEAVYFQDVMQYFPAAKTLYWINWHATEFVGHPGTLMIRRDVPLQYPTQCEKGRPDEDAIAARALVARGGVGYLAGHPELLIYVSHGANAWHDGHHRMLADKLSVSQGLLRHREAQLREGLGAHGFPRDTISVMGSNGPAFTL